MRRLLLALGALALMLPAPVSATWSIIALDRNTGRVVIASATCAAQNPDELKLVQAVVVPGMGVAAAQAGVDRSHANQKLIFEELQKGTAPSEIIRLLEADPSIEGRQFGIIDRQGRMAGRTGANNRAAALHVQGETPEGVVWSVQGNIIASNEALTEAGRIMAEDRGDLIDRVMLAMEKADELGGDSRCTCETAPLPGGSCNGKTSHVAYILAANANDAIGAYAPNHPQMVSPAETTNVCSGQGLPRCPAPWNSGQYHLYIAVYPSNITPQDDSNPVRTLRKRYDAWKGSQTAGAG